MTIEAADATSAENAATDTAAAEASDADATAEQGASEADAAIQEPAKPEWQQRLDKIRESIDEPDEDDSADDAAQAVDDDAAEAGDEGAAEGEAGEADSANAEVGTEEADAVIRLPGRREGDEPFDLPIGDPKVRAALEEAGVDVDEAIERLNQANNGYARRAALQAERAEFDEQRQELYDVYEQLGDVKHVPDFILAHVDATAHRSIAERILSELSDDDYTAVVRRIDEWEQRDGAREADATRAENERLRGERTQRTTSAQAKASRTWAAQVSVELNRLVPESMSDGDAEDFFDFALHKLEHHVASKKARPTPAEIPALLQELRVLERFGLSTGESQTQSARTASADAASRSTRAAATAAQGKTGTTGERLKARADRRRNAATAPAGAGSAAASGIRPPKGQTHEQRMSFIRKRLGLPPKRGS